MIACILSEEKIERISRGKSVTKKDVPYNVKLFTESWELFGFHFDRQLHKRAIKQWLKPSLSSQDSTGRS